MHVCSSLRLCSVNDHGLTCLRTPFSQTLRPRLGMYSCRHTCSCSRPLAVILGSSLATLRSTGPASLPGAGSHRAFGARGGSHLPSDVMMPCKGVAVGTGVLVRLGTVGVAVARAGV